MLFPGTLYWFFYGTAFVIGLLEIIAGELETGVTRFIAVSVKTFVLCLGAGFGLMLTLGASMSDRTPLDDWRTAQLNNCGKINLDDEWWRIPLYLLCCAGVLGQYRFPIRFYWRPLVVQFVAYEVQYEIQKALNWSHPKDNMDNAGSNTVAALSATLVSAVLSVKFCHKNIDTKILEEAEPEEGCSDSLWAVCVSAPYRCIDWCLVSCGLFRDSSALQDLLPKLHSMTQEEKARREVNGDAARRFGRTELENGETHLVRSQPSILLDEHEEKVLLRTMVEDGTWNIWALLMPAVYQLVPGSMIAKLWFNSLFPPSISQSDYEVQNNVFSNLMVISTSLAIGLVLGIAVARTAVNLLKCMGDTCGTHHPDDVEGHMQFQASFYAADIDTDTNTAPKPDAESKNLPFPQDEE